MYPYPSRITATCAQCGATVSLQPNQARTFRFCSRPCKYAARRASLSEHYERRVIRQDGCWEWTGKLDHRGYGRIEALVNRKRVLVSAHRLSWEMVHGPIPDGMGVLHTCDNPPCSNPEHLFIGTPADNAADRVAKGRQPRGEQMGSAKLSTVSATRIITMLAEGKKATEIAPLFGVHRRTVSDIASGKTWAHLPRH